MDARRWARVNEVFHAVLELQGEARDRHLAEACGEDTALASEVRSLLAADARAESFLDTPAAAPEDRAPTQVGPWRIVRELGRGGMGTVYLAERADGAFTMQAALKVLRRGLDTDDLLARFRDERQILASLQHPNIARLLDGGATDDGRPWLAMEYAEGQTLLEYATARQLGQAARLALFRTLTEAVQYAHRNLVVHRDLKPGNVLVTTAGMPKLLDFGIARVLDSPASEQRTKTGQLLLTPAYASPEQLRGERATTAADVWALGVMLYELLVGRRPFQGSGQTLAQAILEQEMPAPGLGVELDAILFTALRKEAAQRYPSVEALADDLDRLAAGQPLRARPATLGYRLGKFVGRHRLAVGAGALVALSLAGGVASTLVQAREAQRARERADASRARAEELVDFMLGDLRRKLEPSSRLDVLEDVSKAVQAYFAALPAAESSPERRARTLHQLASVKLAQSKSDEAAELVRASREALAGSPSTAEVDALRAAAANLQGQVLEARGALDEALQEFDAARALVESVLSRRPPDAHLLAVAGDAHNDRGRVLYGLGRLAEAVQAHEAAAALLGAMELPGREPTLARAKTQLYLGRAREALGAFPEAEAAFRQSLALARALHRDFPEDVELEDYLAISLNDLGRELRLSEKPGDAEPLAVEALALSQAALARDPENAIRIDGLSASHASLGRAREALGQLEAARLEFQADVALSERLLAREPDNAMVQAALADGLTNVGRAERKLGHVAPARAAHQRALTLREALAEKEDAFQVDVAVSRLELGRVQRLAKEDPRPAFEAALTTLREVGGADAPAKQRGRLAQVLLELGRIDEARPIVAGLVAAGAVDAELRALATQHGL